MAIFGHSRINRRCAEQLREMCAENAVAELTQVDSDGRILNSGRSRCIEFDEHTESLFVDLPTNSGRPIVFQDQGHFRILIRFRGSFFTFESPSVVRQLRSGNGCEIPALRLQAPQRLENGNRRRHFRVVPLATSPILAQWRIASSDPKSKNSRPWNKAQVSDISGRGVCLNILFHGTDGLELGQPIEVRLEFQLPSGPQFLTERGRVQRIEHFLGSKREALLAVEFELDRKDPDSCVEEIVSYVTWCQRELARIERERE